MSRNVNVTGHFVEMLLKRVRLEHLPSVCLTQMFCVWDDGGVVSQPTVWIV